MNVLYSVLRRWIINIADDITVKSTANAKEH